MPLLLEVIDEGVSHPHCGPFFCRSHPRNSAKVPGTVGVVKERRVVCPRDVVSQRERSATPHHSDSYHPATTGRAGKLASEVPVDGVLTANE